MGACGLALFCFCGLLRQAGAPGSDLVFQMHYTTNGKARRDESRVGVIFAKEPPQQRVLTLQLTNDHFVIPPGVPNYRVEARGTLPNDATLLSFPQALRAGTELQAVAWFDNSGDNPHTPEAAVRWGNRPPMK